jgi:hypothetical protein
MSHADGPQPIALTETTTNIPSHPKTDPRLIDKLKKCLSLLTNNLIPRAEQNVEQLHRMANRLSGKTMMHRVYYDKAVKAQNELEWKNEVREMFEEALNCGEVMGEDEMQSLEHVESLLLGMWGDDEDEGGYAAEGEEGMED